MSPNRTNKNSKVAGRSQYAWRQPRIFATLALLLPVPGLVAAQEEELPIAAVCPEPAISPFDISSPDREDAPIVLYAHELDASETETSIARGDVELQRADQVLNTQYLEFIPGTQTLVMPEPLQYSDSAVWIHAAEAEYSFLSESGQFKDIDYGLSGSSANGSAESMDVLPNAHAVLHGLDFTTCLGEKPDWQIKAERMDFYYDEGYGKARHARLEFQGVPILYTPWFSFPIDDRRKSGLLYPSLSNTNDNGFEIGVPYYWNIAPNMDATLEPRYFTNRGFMLTGQYRFLTRRMRGDLDFDYMPHDDVTREERYHYLFDHRSKLPGTWSTTLIIDRVSDDQYFQDFGAGLATTSRQFLRSAGVVQGFGHYWSFEAMVDDFQVIDPTVTPGNEPYVRLPRLEFDYDRPFGSTPFGFLVDSELTYFDRDVGVTGVRADVTSALYWERWWSWGFLKPSVGYRYTSYGLDRVALGEDTSPDRGTSISSLDAGLFFDRVLANGNTQTLEPRLFYLYVPYVDQNELPDFDTGEFTFGFSQLYNTNRFSGADRQADANQLSVSLSTRNYRASDGNMLWRFSVGQIFYFENQRVQLKDRPETTDTVSPFIAEFSLNTFRRVFSTAGLQWDWEKDDLDVASFGILYGGDNGERVGFEYRYRRDRVDQFDFRLSWPVNPQWTVLTRVNYSFSDDDLLEAQAGFEYESCCWALRTVYRRYLKNRVGNYRDGIYLELNLKGLASVGTSGQELFYQ